MSGTLVFHPLDGDSLAAITRQLLDQTGERLSALGVSLQVEEDAVRLLARAGSDRDYGARPLRRAIAAQVEDPAAIFCWRGRCAPAGPSGSWQTGTVFRCGRHSGCEKMTPINIILNIIFSGF